MKYFYVLLLFFSTNIIAQEYIKYENDTLYTSSGFKIFKGQSLTFSVGSGTDGNFRFAKIKGNDSPKRLKNKTIVVSKLSNFRVTMNGNPTIVVHTKLVNSKENKKKIRFILFFEKAIYGENGLAPELIIPDEYLNKK